MARFLAPPATEVLRAGGQPTFSTIIAAYNAAHLIGDAVASALQQVPAPMEVVVCDDGSTDDLPGALERFGDAVRYVRVEHGGEARAKNAAAAAARGDYLAVLDADDVFAPGRLAAMADLATERPDLDIITTDAFLDLAGEVVGRAYGPDNPFEVEHQDREILKRNFVFGLVAVRRQAFLDAGGYDEAIKYTTDWDLWVRMVLAGSRVGLVDEPLARYRLHAASMSARRRDMAEGRCMTLAKALARDDLDDAQRAIATDAYAAECRRLEREELAQALEQAGGSLVARRRAWAVLRGRAQPRRARARAAVVFLAPRLASRRGPRAAAASWRTVGDRRVERRAAATAVDHR
jgi:hypothetical protein